MQLLIDLRDANVRVWAEDGRLLHRAPDGLDEALLTRLRTQEREILDYLLNADDCDMSTHYVTMRDGVRLAVDLFRPKRDARLVTEPVPAIWCHDRYHRSSIEDGVMHTKFDSRPWLRAVMRHGYAVAAVDARGTGASMGTRGTEFGVEEAADAYEITEWLAAQSWCTGRIGMFGDSYLAIAQLLAASAAPPHLRAIVPQMVLFDLYDFMYPGGVFRHDFAWRWSERVARLDTGAGVAPVVGQQDLAASAAADHLANADAYARVAAQPSRDSRNPVTGGPAYESENPLVLRAAIDASGVAIHQMSGWYDMWTKDALLWHANVTNPRRLTIDASCHTGRESIDMVHEHVAWFDHWLKGIDNGVMAEPAIRYRVMNSRSGVEWAKSEAWPPAHVRSTSFYFGDGVTGTVASANDGYLTTSAPMPDEAYDDYVVDYRATSGQTSRWANGYGGVFDYGPMTDNDRCGLTYTTAPLPRDIEVTGHPVAHLFITSSHPDGDFFVYLEEVHQDGVSRYVTEGVLRASHRKTSEPPYDNYGLPYHPSAEADREDLPLLPAELVVDLHPTSYLFHRDGRIRATITCCDVDNALTPTSVPPPMVQIHRGSTYPSRIELPLAGLAESADV